VTEQQLDAAVSRYEPYRMCGARGPFWIWFRADAEEWHTDRDTLGARLWRHIKGAMVYYTREAAFADLRNAIRLTGTNAAQE